MRLSSWEDEKEKGKGPELQEEKAGQQIQAIGKEEDCDQREKTPFEALEVMHAVLSEDQVQGEWMKSSRNESLWSLRD